MDAAHLAEPPLSEGEHVIWRGAPNWRRAARPPRRIVGVVAAFGLAMLSALLAIFVINASDEAIPNSLARAAFSVATLIALAAVVVLWAKAIGQAFSLAKPVPRRDPALYLLTNKRLIAHRGPPLETRSIFRAYPLLEARLEKNGSTDDLRLWFGPDFMVEHWDLQEPLVLHALEDGAEAKRLILQSFPAPDPDRQAPAV